MVDRDFYLQKISSYEIESIIFLDLGGLFLTVTDMEL